MSCQQWSEVRGLVVLNVALYGPWLAMVPFAWWHGGFEWEFLAKLAPTFVASGGGIFIVGFLLHWRRPVAEE
jgi:hypothetical protein